MAKLIYSRQSLFRFMIPEGYESIVTERNDNQQQKYWKEARHSYLELQTQSEKLLQVTGVFKFSRTSNDILPTTRLYLLNCPNMPSTEKQMFKYVSLQEKLSLILPNSTTRNPQNSRSNPLDCEPHGLKKHIDMGHLKPSWISLFNNIEYIHIDS